MKKKFSHFKNLSKIYRVRGIEKTRHNSIRLDFNERVSPFSNSFIKSIRKKINSSSLSAYPEVEKLYNLLAKKLKLKKENILLTPGSDTGMRHCFEVFVKSKSKIITLDPTFGMVDVYAKLFEAKQIKINFNKNLQLNLNKLINSINKSVSMIMFANPNSPTGTIIKNQDIIKILKKAKKNNCYVIIDEAYFGFYKWSAISLIKKFNNLIILRTFSKAYGLAGIRSAYIVSNKKIMSQLYKFRTMYEINSIGILITKEVMKSNKIFNQYINQTKIGKKYLLSQLKYLGLKSHKSFSNFILVDFKSKKRQLRTFKLLKKNNILVRFAPKIDACKNYLRFTLGPKSFMQDLIRVLKKVN